MARVTLLALLLALLAACGAPANDPTITLQDMRFSQDEVHVKAGAPVTVHLVNRDGYAHAFDIDEFAIHAPLAAGATFDATFTPTQPGSYRFYCGSPGHTAAGMAGVLVVEP